MANINSNGASEIILSSVTEQHYESLLDHNRGL